MIVTATDDDGKELFRIRFELLDFDETVARYSVQVATDRGDAIGLHRRSVHYYYRLNNALALLKLAMDSLDPESFDLEDDNPSPPDLARRQPRIVREIQARASRLRHYRSSVRRGQPEQSGSDAGREEVGEEDRQ